MKLTVLTENTACRADLQAVHGLSLLLEMEEARLLLDVGPGEEFCQNARAMGIDLRMVDLCVISHGHDDHGGGLRRFLKENDHAPVYLAEGAFEPHFAGEEDIGLDVSLKAHPQVRLAGVLEQLSDQVTLFSQVPGDTLVPAANSGLLDAHGPDAFLHEQDLLVSEGDKLYLFGGCAHRGIVNILEQAKLIAGRYPDVVVSGLHLAAGGTGKCMADAAYLDKLSESLLKTGAVFYSCHCTGAEALRELQARMGERLKAISAGMVLEL